MDENWFMIIFHLSPLQNVSNHTHMDNGKFILDKHYKMLALVAQLDARPTGN